MTTPRHPKHEIPAGRPLCATLLAMALAAIAHDAHAAKDVPVDDLALIEFLGNTGGTETRVREPDALWLLDELAQTESMPSTPARARAGRPEEKKP